MLTALAGFLRQQTTRGTWLLLAMAAIEERP
jgi:hypothetical protein